MFCELCASYEDTERAKIITDGGEEIEGKFCLACRTTRELCTKCGILLPSHGPECSLTGLA
jgi:hypothetical protein